MNEIRASAGQIIDLGRREEELTPTATAASASHVSACPGSPVGEAFRYKGRVVYMEDIPESVRDLADFMDLEVLFQLLELCGGQVLYFPRPESLLRNARDREIQRRFNGGNYKQLRLMFRLSERQLRKIIKGHRT